LRKLQPVSGLIEASGLDQSGGGKAGPVDQRRGAESEALADPVRLLGDEADDREVAFPMRRLSPTRKRRRSASSGPIAT
jgi:hypothetical protein